MHLELDRWRAPLAELAAGAAGNDGAHDASHLERVWRNAQALLAHHPEADALVVMAACYLHDLVNLPEERSRARPGIAALGRAGARGAGAARLSRASSWTPWRTPSKRTASRPRSRPRRWRRRSCRTPTASIRSAPSAWRACSMSPAAWAARLAHATDPLAETRALDDQAWSLDHIVVKLAKLPAMMQTRCRPRARRGAAGAPDGIPRGVCRRVARERRVNAHAAPRCCLRR